MNLYIRSDWCNIFGFQCLLLGPKSRYDGYVNLGYRPYTYLVRLCFKPTLYNNAQNSIVCLQSQCSLTADNCND